MLQFSWIREHLGQYSKRYIVGVILATIFPLTALINPNYSRQLVDDVLIGGQHEKLIPLVVTMCIVTLCRTIIGFIMVMLCETSSQGLIYNLRTGMYRQLQRLDRGFFNRYRTGDLMTAMTSDIDMVRHNVNYIFRTLLSSSVMFLGATIYFFTINWKFTLALIAVAPFILLVSRHYIRSVREIYVELRERLSELNTVAQENIEGNRVVKAFANEAFEIGRFDDRNKAFQAQNLTASFTWLKFFPYLEVLAQSMTITTMLFGGLFIMWGQLSFGEFMAINSLSWAITDPFRQLGPLLNDLQRFFASSSKLIEMQMVEPRIKNKKEPYTGKGKIRGEIEFRDVDFGYGDKPVLEGVSFKAAPGETVAFMGETGTGKTTIANLITRFYDVKDGSVRVDGTDVKNWDLHTLRSSIGMAMQDVFLFSDTVDGNIAYGDPDLPEEDVKKFAVTAAAQFIENMTDGYDTIVGERGVGLSGGQKQRISLARALATRPSILILDDTTSAVDMETEKYIQEQLAELDFDCTKLIIAQRISSVRNADKIVILADHKIVEMGSHEELLDKRGYYYDIYRIQSGLPEEELEQLLARRKMASAGSSAEDALSALLDDAESGVVLGG